MTKSRRQFLKSTGLGLASLPFALNLPSLCFANQHSASKDLLSCLAQWHLPQEFLARSIRRRFQSKRILEPLASFQKQTLVLKGISDKVRGDGEGHMRGIGCLLTVSNCSLAMFRVVRIRLLAGPVVFLWIRNLRIICKLIHTSYPIWFTGIRCAGSEKADTWTRLCYAGPNKPIAPIDDPYQMFNRLYGRAKDRAAVASILDEVRDDLAKLSKSVSTEDRRLLDEHTAFVRDMEKEFTAPQATSNRMPYQN